MKRQRSEHMIQSLFLITLLGLFFICAVGVIAMGAGVYQKISDESSTDYQVRTSLTYIAEKARQCDQAGGLELSSLDDGTPALKLPSTYGDIPYVTFIYEYNHSLRELFVKADASTDAALGSSIMELTSLELVDMGSGVIQISVTDTDRHTTSLLLHSSSQTEDTMQKEAD